MESHNANNLCIEIIGDAGSGKSKLVPLVVNELEEISNQPELCNEAENLNLLKNIQTIIHNPQLIIKAHTLCKHMKGKYGGVVGYLYWLKRFSKIFWHQPVAPNVNSLGIWVFDEGIVHYLRKSKYPLTSKLLHQLPLPDLVICIRADWQDRMRRIIQRKKPLYKSEILRGTKRTHKASVLAEGFLSQHSHSETLDLLNKWSLKFCKPPLSKTALNRIIQKANPKTKKKKSSRFAWLKPAINAAGVDWLDFRNSWGSDPKKTSRDIANAIWEKYLNEAKSCS